MAQSVTGRERRKRRIRKKIFGDAARPRLSVFRSAKHIYAQVVDDLAGNTLAYASSTVSKDIQGVKTEQAKAVGKSIAEACKSKGIEQVVFDRNGYIYHGRIRALADAAREAGLKF
ncbi:MAG: 50S ribosomal protein L18 [Myxococcales bacterium]|nr:MAG: 50S ribosomal protein L18 [Myxococcales bacterium]